MPVRIRLSRGGAKKRPYYRIVVADSRRARDGKFTEQIGTYNPMLKKDNPERVKIDIDKAKEWIAKGAQPSDRVTLFLSTMGVVEKPIITEKTSQESEMNSRYTFMVDKSSNKIEIKRAVESYYGVSVERVRTMNYGPERKIK